MSWPVFITLTSSLYVGFHAYALWKTVQAIPLGRGLYAASIAFIIIMASVQFIVRYLVSSGHNNLARGFALVGFTWTGFLFLFVCASMVEDGYRIMIKTAAFFSDKMNPKWILPRPAALFTILLVSGGITIYGLIDAIRFRMEHVTVETEKIPLGLKRFRIVQISDVHLGLIVRKDRLRRIVEKVKTAKPDLLVSTGDLVDGSAGQREDLAAMLRELTAKHGKFAITGNHEYYAGIRGSMDFIQRAGFTFLPGKSSSFLPWLSIAGVDDPAGGGYANTDALAALSQIPKGHFALLLKHRPYLAENSIGLFDLQLSGHTHKGQIFPFTLVIKLLFPVDAGRVDLENGSTLYVSRGTGTWGPPIRFLSPPEVTVIDLVPRQSPSQN